MTDIKKILHDLRTHMSIVEICLQVNAVRMGSEDELALLKNARTSLVKMNELISSLSSENTEDTVYGYLNPSLRGVPQRGTTRQSSPENNSQTILVIDDDPVAREKTVAKLKEEGNDVIALEKGEDLLTGNIDFSKIKSAVIKRIYTKSALSGEDVVEYLRGRGIQEIAT